MGDGTVLWAFVIFSFLLFFSWIHIGTNTYMNLHTHIYILTQIYHLYFLYFVQLLIFVHLFDCLLFLWSVIDYETAFCLFILVAIWGYQDFIHCMQAQGLCDDILL